MIHAAWLLVAVIATIPAGAFAGYLVFAHRANDLYTNGRRDGWRARGVYEREHRNGHVIEMVEEIDPPTPAWKMAAELDIHDSIDLP